MTIQEIVDLGKAYRDERSYEEAYGYFLEGAIANNAEAIENLGLLYLLGEGVDQNEEKAFRYYRMYYDMTGDKDMLMNISDCLSDLLNRKEGCRLYRELLEYLIDNGEWDIWIQKGFGYREGTAYPKDLFKAIDCFEQAISHGVSMGYECLGEMYFLGEGVEQNYKKAYEFFQSCEGHSSFIKPYYLGEMYRLGLYVENNFDKAKQEYRRIVDSPVKMRAVDSYYIKAARRLRYIEGLK